MASLKERGAQSDHHPHTVYSDEELFQRANRSAVQR